jgi:DNA-binding GntR family transcriptional regulator
VDIADSQLEIEMVPASDFDARHLGVKRGEMVVQVNSLDYDATAKVVGFIRTVVRAENFFFAVDMHRKSGAPTRRPLTELVAGAGD